MNKDDELLKDKMKITLLQISHSVNCIKKIIENIDVNDDKEYIENQLCHMLYYIKEINKIITSYYNKI